MKIQQHAYLSPEAQQQRRQDGTRPWECHPCELDSVGRPDPADMSMFAQSWRAADALRREIEGAA